MRILVTGGAGFLGSHLCDLLLSQGHHVICADNFITGRRQNVDHLLGHPGFTLLEADVREPLAVTGPLDFVLHFASPASPQDYLRLPIETLQVGALGTQQALELALQKQAAFLLASTSEVYGDPQVSPQPETYWGNVNPVGHRGAYDEAKRYAEALVMAYHRVHRLDTRIIRIFNTYGPRMRPDDGRAVPTFIRQALKGEPLTLFGDGSQTRSFCYVTDLVEGVTAALEVHHPCPINLGNPQELTIQEVARLVLALTGASSPITRLPLPMDDPKVRKPDISLARRLLSWEPKVPLEEGLQETIRWFKAQGV